MNPSVRQRHRQELREAILDAAREMFARDGYENFSMRKLAARIEYSPGSIYLYFKNKEELFTSLVEQSFGRLLEALLALNKESAFADPVAGLRKGLRIYVDFGLHNVSDYRFAFMMPRAAARRYRPHPAFDVLREMVSRCVEQKRFRDVDVELASQAIWAAAHGVTSLLIQRPEFPWVKRDELIGQVVDGAVDSWLACVQGRARAQEGVSDGSKGRRSR